MNPGPCILCGTTNYPMSMGGPTICPACDCGIAGHPYPDRYSRRVLGKGELPDHDERNECGAPTLLGRCTKPKGHTEVEDVDSIGHHLRDASMPAPGTGSQ